MQNSDTVDDVFATNEVIQRNKKNDIDVFLRKNITDDIYTNLGRIKESVTIITELFQNRIRNGIDPEEDNAIYSWLDIIKGHADKLKDLLEELELID